ncbi:PREDICTED: uncharacterized protein LOC108561347 [Nicrophorus vespilloides]|uniref:Uncharacterized protein LOC108561347 n=1 Tax=Nicrophorus vespilloides TaxID=110193 RepID=A0ABM1MJH2_NICVS|nr:PREDICTED: uncharacterized protein LOC108561347 [Nicrophorus vespilloides]
MSDNMQINEVLSKFSIKNETAESNKVTTIDQNYQEIIVISSDEEDGERKPPAMDTISISSTNEKYEEDAYERNDEKTNLSKEKQQRTNSCRNMNKVRLVRKPGHKDLKNALKDKKRSKEVTSKNMVSNPYFNKYFYKYHRLRKQLKAMVERI